MKQPVRRHVGISLQVPPPPAPAAALALLMAYVGPDEGAAGTTPVALTLTFDGTGQTFSRDIDLPPGETLHQFPIHTHLLPNGPLKLILSVVAESGAVIGEAELAFEVRNEGPLAEAVRASLQRNGTPLVIDGLCDTSFYDYDDEAARPWFDRPDAMAHIRSRLGRGEIDESEAETLAFFVTNGYLVVDDLIEPALIEQIRGELDDAVARKIQGYEYGSSERIRNLHLVYPGVRRLWAHPKVMHLLGNLFEAKPRPCQTLTFIFGSQQDPHQDTIHLTPFPAGYMCGVWVAIDDVQPESGELEVLRASHRLPRVTMQAIDCPKVTNEDWSEFGRKAVARWEEMRATSNFERFTYRPKAGTVLVWHENLMHGGSVRVDKSKSRRSIVSHVFADGAIAFYDSSGMVGTMASEEELARPLEMAAAND